jgi:hypothetical protein
MPARMSHEQYVSRMRAKHPTITVGGEYVCSSEPVKLSCNVCQHNWSATPCRSNAGTGCPKCSGCLQLTNEQYVSRMKVQHPTITVIGKYVVCSKQVKLSCNVCQHVWSATPNSSDQGCGCPKCGNAKRIRDITDTTVGFINKARGVHGTYDYSLVNYKDSKTKVAIVCPSHGVFNQTPNSHLSRRQGCPKCANVWKAETHMSSLLNSHGISFETQTKSLVEANKRLSVDFFLASENLAIETAGQFHYRVVLGGRKGLVAQQRRDRQKEIGLAARRIQLLVIPYVVPMDLRSNLVWFRQCAGAVWAKHKSAIKTKSSRSFIAQFLTDIRNITTPQPSRASVQVGESFVVSAV